MAEKQTSPAPKSSGGKSMLHTVFPMGSFEGEGFPTILLEGTEVTSTEADAAKAAAEANGVTLVEGDS
jgi:hypothetical protein